jgi:hypothetical protein
MLDLVVVGTVVVFCSLYHSRYPSPINPMVQNTHFYLRETQGRTSIGESIRSAGPLRMHDGQPVIRGGESSRRTSFPSGRASGILSPSFFLVFASVNVVYTPAGVDGIGEQARREEYHVFRVSGTDHAGILWHACAPLRLRTMLFRGGPARISSP